VKPPIPAWVAPMQCRTQYGVWEAADEHCRRAARWTLALL
jgi:hypothetical protein